MKDNKNRKSIKTLAEDLKIVRRRPLSPQQQADLNKIFEKDIEEIKKDHLKPAQKIAVHRDKE